MTTFSPLARYLKLLPLLLLLTAEAVALSFVYPPVFSRPESFFPLLIAALVVLTGLLPAVLRPSADSVLAGCLTTLVAGLIMLPFRLTDFPQTLVDFPGWQVIPPHALLRFANGLIVGPVALHLASRFPRPSGLKPAWVAAAYAVTALAGTLMIVSPPYPLRLGVIGIVALALQAQIVKAFHYLWLASRDADSPHTAQQARLILACLLIAGIPLLLRPIGLYTQVIIVPESVMLVAMLFIPLGMTYTILRTDLFDIDAALRRALGYGALSLLFLAAYLGLTVALTAAFARTWPGFPGVAAAASLILAAVAFEPLRRRVQGWIDRVFYPDRLRFQREVAAAQERLARVVRRDEITTLLTEELPPRLGVGWATLSLAPAPDIPLPADDAPAWNGQLSVGGKWLGRYWLGPRKSGASFDADEQTQLKTLAQQAALALAYADVFEQLRELNRELERRVADRTEQVLEQQRTLAAYGERQKLARDLHDSVSQTLFSVGLSARALRSLVRRDPQAAVSGLAELESAIAQTQAEMRALLVQLREEQGEEQVASSKWQVEGGRSQVEGGRLPVEENRAGSGGERSEVDLVKLIADHCATLPISVELCSPAALVLPAPFAAELLQMVREALHNVVKYSGVAHAECRVERDERAVILTISDEGLGFDPAQIPEGHFGLRGIGERAAALGGSMEVQSSPGAGATLRVIIPVK